MLPKSSPAYIQRDVPNIKNYSEMVMSSKYKAEPFYPTDLRVRSYRQTENEVSFFTFFFFNWTNNSALEERSQIHSNMDEKIHCLCKINPFLQTAAKEKPPAGMMMWPAKLANVEMIIKWQHPGGLSIPGQSPQSRWPAT